jgi:aminoglycoside phosphotransferase (APT) family kinase protein
MLEREVQLIEHIRKYTTASVAEIIGYSTEHENCLGFPYIVMTELPGKPAHSVWYDGNYEDSDVELLFQHADTPFTAIEKKRITLLRSLARVMTDIQSLSFEQGGMPIISDTDSTTIGPMYLWENNGSDKA